MRFEVLGSLQVTVDGERLSLGSPMQQKLLALLLAADSHVVSIDRLVDEMWGEDPPPSAAHLVQVYVSRLRGIFGERDRAPEIRRDGSGYVMEVDLDSIDAAHLTRLIAEADDLGSDNPTQVEHVLTEAAELWRGRPYGTLADESALLQAEAQRLDDLHVRGLEGLFEARLGLGRHHESVASLEALTAQYPHREGFWGQLMLALYRSGRQAEALRVCQTLRRMLGEELGIEPAVSIQELEERILVHDPALLWETPPPPSNLPIQLTTFVGRSSEIASVCKLLDTSRLVTLTGSGGIGKTRLAIEVAGTVLSRFPDGVWWVDLAPVSDPSQVAVELAAALGLVPQQEGMLLQAIASSLARRDALLIVDNCEHVAAAAADIVIAVLKSAPRVRCLATSRRPLHVPGELLWTVPALATPSPDAADPAQMRPADAVRLFEERAATADPGFELTSDNVATVAELCRRLDGIPLAIEMAAARIRVMSPAQIGASMGDRFAILVDPSRGVDDRHATLAAALAWSYDLMDVPLRTAFERSAVFAGPFDLADVAAVAIGSGDELSALQAVTGLVEWSMCSRVAADPARVRYRLLDTHRDYGLSKLMQRGDVDTVREVHANHYLRNMTDAAGAVGTPELTVCVDRLQASYEDVQRALEWSLANHSRERTLEAAPALFQLWYRTGNAPDAKKWGAQMLAGSDDVAGELRAAAHLCLGFSGAILLDPEAALQHSGEAVRILRQSDDRRALVTGLFGHAQSQLLIGEFATAATCCTEALDICDEIDSHWDRAGPLATLGLINLFGGRLDAARRFAEEALLLHRELADRAGLVVLNALPTIAMKQGDYATAEHARRDSNPQPSDP